MTDEEKLIWFFVSLGIIVWLFFTGVCINEIIHSGELKIQSEKNKINPIYFEMAAEAEKSRKSMPTSFETD